MTRLSAFLHTKRFHQLLALATSLRLVMFFSNVPLVAAAETVQHPVQVHTVQDVLSPEDLLAQTNANRLAAGLPPLSLNAELEAAAEAKAEDMVANGYWDHFRPGDHKAPWDFIDESGYHYRVAGENLARGFRTAQGITTAWMHSPAHAANILNKKYKEVGFATVYTYNGQGEREMLTVQMFGSR